MEIILEKINKAYDGKNVLSDFSLVLTGEQPVALMGSSGIGKTTVARIILGLEKADAGEVKIPSGTRFSAVFQEDRLLENTSVHRNLAVVCKDEKDEEDVLEKLFISEFRNMRVRELSGGQKRRVAIARALLAKADAYILDEAFNGLDKELKAEVMAFVKSRLQGKPVLFITHDEDEAKLLGCIIKKV